MNNVGEFFFSSPIDPFDVSKDWGRSDDDQRHRLVISGALQSPSKAPTSPIEYLTHGFEVSAMLQAYSALATEHHLWRHDNPRHGRSADRRWSVHSAQRRRGKRLPGSERPCQSHASPQRPRSARRAGGGVQPDESCERVDTQRQLRSRRVSVEPIAHVRPDYRCRRTPVVSVGRARPILRSARQRRGADCSTERLIEASALSSDERVLSTTTFRRIEPLTPVNPSCSEPLSVSR